MRAGAAAMVATLLATPTADARASSQIRAEAHPVWGAVAAGITISVLSYAPAVVAGIVSTANGNLDGVPLFVPVVGPLIAAPIFASESDDSKHVFAAGIVADGVAQACGLALIVYGLLTKTAVETDRARIVPVLIPGGIGIAGSF